MLQPVAGELLRARGELQPRPARHGGDYAGLQPSAGCAAAAPRFLAGTDARGELDGHHGERGEQDEEGEVVVAHWGARSCPRPRGVETGVKRGV